MNPSMMWVKEWGGENWLRVLFILWEWMALRKTQEPVVGEI